MKINQNEVNRFYEALGISGDNQIPLITSSTNILSFKNPSQQKTTIFISKLSNNTRPQK
jgi:hypothetical protein